MQQLHGARIYAEKGVFYLKFPYSPLLVELIKAVPGHRKWSPDHKAWALKPSKAALRYVLQHFNPQMDAEVARYAEELDQKTVHAAALRERKESDDVPEIRDYAFKTTPFDHQKRAFALSRDIEAYALLMEQGTGKSKVIVDTAADLFSRGKIEAVLIIAPNSVKTNWVTDEFPVHLPTHVPYRAAYHTAQPSKAEAKEIEAMMDAPMGELRVFVMNIEALSLPRGQTIAKNFLQRFRCMMVIDESSRIKTPGAKRTKAAIRLGKLANYRRILTGTPVTQGAIDLYTQFAFLDEDILGFGSFYAFRNHYCVMGGFEQRQIIAYQNLPELQDSIAGYSFRVLKKDCLDLPEKIYQKRYVEHSDEQRAAYKTMRDSMFVGLRDGSLSTAKIALTQLLRFQQINSNFLLNEDNVPVSIGDTNPRMDELVAVCEEAGGKAIIWARFRHEIEDIHRRLEKEFGRGCAVMFYGGMSDEQRIYARQQLQDKNSPVVFFVGQPDAGGIGLTLTEASTVVYYSNTFSLENRLQSEDRAHRIGQTRNVTYIDLITRGTIDVKVVAALRGKRDIASMITQDNLGDWI